MNAEVIRKKIHELDQQKEQAIAQLNAIAGAQQVCRELLEEAEKEETPDD